MAKHETPFLDQLESGPWPSFVSDLKQQAEVRAKNEKGVEFQIPQDCVDDLLGGDHFYSSLDGRSERCGSFITTSIS